MNNNNNKIKLFKIYNEIIEIRIIENNIIISLISWYINNQYINLKIKNLYINNNNNNNNKFYFLKEIQKYSFSEFKYYFYNLNKFNQQLDGCVEQDYNFMELKQKYQNVPNGDGIIILYNNNKNSITNNNIYNNKKLIIKSIMFGGEKIVGEDEEQPLLLNKDSDYITINENINSDNNAVTNKINNGASSPPISKLSIFLFLNVLFSVLSTLQFGYNTGVISPTIVEIQKLLNLSINQKSILVSSVLFGAMAGSFGSAFFVDRIGRKWSLILNNIFYVLGPFLCSIGNNYVTLLFGRLITGIGVGVASSVVPLYIGEISPTSYRGALGLLRQSTVTFGIMLSSLVAYGLLAYSNGWRYTFAIAAAPSIIQLLLSYWFVETPRYLISKNKSDQAKSIIKRIEPHLSDQEIDQQIFKIRQSINEQQGNDGGWLSLFQIQYIKIYIIAFGLNMLQQLVGINCVIYYSTIILQDAGFVKNTAVLISALVGIPQLIMLLISVWLIDRFGRKPLLIYGLIGMIVGMAVLGYPFYGNTSSTGQFDNKTKGWIAVAGMIFFKLMFSVGLGPIPTIVTSEIIPSKIRGKAMAISQLLNWLGNCIVNIMYLHMVDSGLGQAGTFWFFGGISLITLLFVVFLVPETKGISIEELSKKLLYQKNK